MIISKDFTKRLGKIIDYHGLSASSFAEKVGVQRSSISHILSGRNKPSLEFVMKVLSSFPDVDLYWLLNGKGNFPKESINKNSIIDEKSNSDTNKINLENISTPSSFKNLEIERIVFFFKNGSFKNFENS